MGLRKPLQKLDNDDGQKPLQRGVGIPISYRHILYHVVDNDGDSKVDQTSQELQRDTNDCLGEKCTHNGLEQRSL